MKWFIGIIIFAILSANSAWAGKCTLQLHIQKGWLLNRTYHGAVAKEMAQTTLPICIQEMVAAYQSLLPQVTPESKLTNYSFYESEGQATLIEIHRIKDAPQTYKWSLSIYNDDSDIVPGACFGAMAGVGQHKERVGRDLPYTNAVMHTNPVYVNNTNMIDCTRTVLTKWGNKNLRKDAGGSFRSSYVLNLRILKIFIH